MNAYANGWIEEKLLSFIRNQVLMTLCKKYPNFIRLWLEKYILEGWK